MGQWLRRKKPRSADVSPSVGNRVRGPSLYQGAEAP